MDPGIETLAAHSLWRLLQQRGRLAPGVSLVAIEVENLGIELPALRGSMEPGIAGERQAIAARTEATFTAGRYPLPAFAIDPPAA